MGRSIEPAVKHLPNRDRTPQIIVHVTLAELDEIIRDRGNVARR
jgi:hypothetical protein